MRNSFSCLMAGAVAVLLTAGCAGPEQKLGRGIRNSVEFARMGEMRHSMEQAALFDGPRAAYTTGVIRGINRSIARTVVGAYEVVTFPLPSYDPLLKGPEPVYPESFKPGRHANTIFATDSNLGFSGGEVIPIIWGSRFRIFDY